MDVRRPSPLTCCTAIARLPVGMVKPRRPDHDLLSRLVDAGLPGAPTTVRVSALRQVPRWVPTLGLVEGIRTPRRAALAMTAFVVEHPRARFVVDPGMCSRVRERVLAQLPAVLRVAVGPPDDVVSTADALRDAPEGLDVDFALPTHLHWDHVCGLLDLPTLPLRVHGRELEWITADPVAPVGGVRDSLRDRQVDVFELDGPPVATFERSHDLFGDGSVLLVDLAGHTPGSVGVLAHTDEGWVLLAGDAAWHSAGVEHVRQRPSYPGLLVDEDRDRCFETLHRLHAVKDRIRIVPTHDHGAAAALPRWGGL